MEGDALSADFMCWEPSLEINQSSPSFGQQLRSAQKSKEPPSEKMLVFVARLTAKYPDLTTTDDTPWADGPLTGDISGKFIHFGVSWSWYEKDVVAFIVETGHSLGLLCYDLQTGILHKSASAPVAMETTAGLSQPKSFDGAYKGSLECEQSGFEAFRMPLAISIREGRVTGGASILDIDGRQVGPELGFGTVNPDGTFNLGYILYTRNYSTHVSYSGTLEGTGGTLTGTQVLTREITGDVVTRTCKGTFLQVEPQKH